MNYSVMSVQMLKQGSLVEAVQKQLEIFLFTCLQNLLAFSNQVQIKSNIRFVQKIISKIIFKGDKIGWNLEQKIPQQQVIHLMILLVHMPMPLGLATPYDLSMFHSLWRA